MSRAFRMLGILGLLILMQAWGTSACLFASTVRSLVGSEGSRSEAGSSEAASEGVASACASTACCCCRKAIGATQSSRIPTGDRCGGIPGDRSGSDECPLCSSIGNTHELVPLGVGPALPPPSITHVMAGMTACATAPDERAHVIREVCVIPRPTPEAFCATIALLR